MNKTITKLKGSLLTAAALGALAASPAFAQLNYRPAGATNVVTTYTDLGTAGTAITTANKDNANSTAQPIGFTFNYNGQAFTDFILNTNGFIKLGTTAPSAATLINAIGSASNADVNILAPSSNIDLQGAANQTTNPTEYRVATTGTAPNRVTTIQFENLADKASASAAAQFATMQFQIKLYETTNVVEFVYGTWTSNGAPAAGQPFIIGIKGSSNAVTNRLMAFKGSSTAAWSTTTFVNEDPSSPGFLVAHFIRNAMLPDAGRTYRFTPITLQPNDLAVKAIFVMGKMARNYGTGDTIKAIIENTGTATVTNRPVMLSVTGVNAFTSSVPVTLAPGEDTLVKFAPFMPTVFVPTNFVEVTVPNDDDNTNNAKDANITVTQNTIGYAQYPPQVNSKPDIVTALPGQYPLTGRTPANINGNFLAKFFTSQTINITKVRAYIPGAAFNPDVRTTGITVYGVVLDATGLELGRSANKVIAASDVDKMVEFTLTTPVAFSNESYFIGLALPAQPTATATIFPMATQEEDEIRMNTFFVSAENSNTPPIDFEDTYRFVLEADFTTVTGIKESLNAKLVSVFPNPSNGTFHVSAKAMKGNNAAMEVRDMQGKLVYSAKASKEDATLNLNNLSSGVYMLRVATDQEIAVKRIVIK